MALLVPAELTRSTGRLAQRGNCVAISRWTRASSVATSLSCICPAVIPLPVAS